MHARHSPRALAMLVRLGAVVWIAAGIAVFASAVRSFLPSRSLAPAPTTPGTTTRAPAPAPQRTPIPSDSPSSYHPDQELRDGREVVMIFLGASFCGADREPGFPEAIERAKLLVQQRAKESGRGFRAIAISLDWEPDTALAFLEPFGRWDELSVGGNWANDAALRYLWGEFSAAPTVPQVLLLERLVEIDDAVRVSGTRELRRLVGAPQITQWIAGGAAL